MSGLGPRVEAIGADSTGRPGNLESCAAGTTMDVRTLRTGSLQRARRLVASPGHTPRGQNEGCRRVYHGSLGGAGPPSLVVRRHGWLMDATSSADFVWREALDGRDAMRSRYHSIDAMLFLLLVCGRREGYGGAGLNRQLARRYFDEATKLCERDAGRLWGVSLCGPMVIGDPATGTRATSQPEPEGQPPRFPGFADGPVTWGGVRWFYFPLPMLRERGCRRPPAEYAPRAVPSHPARARIPPGNDGSTSISTRSKGASRSARVARAPPSAWSRADDRAGAIADALAFRRERRRLFPGAADNERRDEIREGLASYTGIAAWADSPADARRAAALRWPGAKRRPSSGISKPRPAPPTECCWTMSCRGGAGSFVAHRILATCSPQRRTGHRRRTLPRLRRATMVHAANGEKRAIGRSGSASPSCANASLMGPS